MGAEAAAATRGSPDFSRHRCAGAVPQVPYLCLVLWRGLHLATPKNQCNTLRQNSRLEI